VKRGNSRGAKGPCRSHVFIRGKEIRLDTRPTMEESDSLHWDQNLGKPCAGNLHARFEEGGGGGSNRPTATRLAKISPVSRPSFLYLRSFLVHLRTSLAPCSVRGPVRR
jgi:hypothetical protein